MANALKPSNYLLCRHGAGRNPGAHLRERAEAGTARGLGCSAEAGGAQPGTDLLGPSPTGPCFSAPRCGAAGMKQKGLKFTRRLLVRPPSLSTVAPCLLHRQFQRPRLERGGTGFLHQCKNGSQTRIWELALGCQFVTSSRRSQG